MNTSSGQLYLREDAYFEPLFNQWYAWPYLLPPVTAARHMIHTHKRIMTSFVNNHQLHRIAVREPGMAGGEFLDGTEDQVADVQALLEQIDRNHKDLVELSDAVGALDELLRSHTSGESLECLYAHIPGPLKGYVELYFDMNHHPSYRLIEPLLYRSRYYKPALQSASFGLLDKAGQRPFVLSTPRLPDANHLQLAVDFNDPLLDRIFRARAQPLEEGELDLLFRERPTKGRLSYADLFTSSAPSRTHRMVQQGVRLEYLGHAGFLVETSDVSILVDPVIAVRGQAHADELISYSELPPRIDFICVTHSHQDHANIETLLQLRYKTKRVLVPKNNGGTLVDPSLRLLLKQLGFDVMELDDLDEVSIPGGRLVCVPFLGEHGDLHIRSKTAWFVEIGGQRVFFGADSCNVDPAMYRHVRSIIGGVDILAMGMECVGAPYTWLYGALTTQQVAKNIKGSRRLNGSNSRQALQMVETFKPRQVLIYALGQEPWYKYFVGLDYTNDSQQLLESGKVLKACELRGIPAETLYGKKTIELA
ncbi:MBL fold metallo-hydrolase [Sorangium sp. So ce341]|uniref:MBL fold metallo-hydrolase n=1 Tax=Sorangium sp. So ce341 TaxID=3133302 RepID=UPI003F5E69B6